MVERLAIYDVDHTITRRSTGEYFLFEACRKKVLPLSIFLSLPAVYFRYRFGRLQWDTWSGTITAIKDIPRTSFEALALAAFQDYHRNALVPRVIESIAAYQQAGVPVYLATSSVDLLVQPLADHLGTQGMIATRLEFEDGTSTGRILGRPVFGAEKRQRILKLIAELGLRPADCAFYSDSIHDQPLLAAVGRPVTVNPDLRLKTVARRRGWEIWRC